MALQVSRQKSGSRTAGTQGLIQVKIPAELSGHHHVMLSATKSHGFGTHLLHVIAVTRVVVAFPCVVSVMGAWADYRAGLDAFQRGDYATALRVFRRLAEKVFARGQKRLGKLYYFGWGVRQDDVEAAWLRLRSALAIPTALPTVVPVS